MEKGQLKPKLSTGEIKTDFETIIQHQIKTESIRINTVMTVLHSQKSNKEKARKMAFSLKKI